MGRPLAAALLVALVLATGVGAAPAFRLTSPAFKAEKTIPARYTCRGQNVSPALNWTTPPARARSFALELHDPDAQRPGGFTHWIGWGFSASSRGLAVGRRAPVEGDNDRGERGYTGPCPPSGVHRYRFTVWALDRRLFLPAGSERADFQRALRGHVVGRAQLVGRFGASG